MMSFWTGQNAPQRSRLLVVAWVSTYPSAVGTHQIVNPLIPEPVEGRIFQNRREKAMTYSHCCAFVILAIVHQF